MGEVWEAHQVALGRSVAIKFLSHEEGGPRFRREAQAIWYRLVDGPAQSVIATLYGIYCAPPPAL